MFEALEAHLMQELDILQEVPAALHVCHRLTQRQREAQVCKLQSYKQTVSAQHLRLQALMCTASAAEETLSCYVDSVTPKDQGLPGGQQHTMERSMPTKSRMPSLGGSSAGSGSLSRLWRKGSSRSWIHAGAVKLQPVLNIECVYYA